MERKLCGAMLVLAAIAVAACLHAALDGPAHRDIARGWPHAALAAAAADAAAPAQFAARPRANPYGEPLI